MTDHANTYEDARRAEAYAGLEFPGTYFLAYRDLPEIIAGHAVGRKALDFGCGTGRSTRFLRRLGFEATGVDIAEAMIRRAKDLDPGGDYRLISDESLESAAGRDYDLVLSVFTFDNIPSTARRIAIFERLGRLLAPGGRIVALDSTPDIYTHEWASFSTRDFPENALARSGDIVRIVMKDVEDARPVEDIFWTDADYRECFRRAGLEAVAVHRPLARPGEPFPWVNETKIAPWVIYVLKKAGRPGSEF